MIDSCCEIKTILNANKWLQSSVWLALEVKLHRPNLSHDSRGDLKHLFNCSSENAEVLSRLICISIAALAALFALAGLFAFLVGWRRDVV